MGSHRVYGLGQKYGMKSLVDMVESRYPGKHISVHDVEHPLHLEYSKCMIKLSKANVQTVTPNSTLRIVIATSHVVVHDVLRFKSSSSS